MKYTTPFGPIWLAASDKGITEVAFEPLPESENNLLLQQASQQLSEYFTGTRRHFELPLDYQGTAFQEAAWQGLLTIPYGTTWNYQELATAIGRPKAIRAVGQANRRNPLAILIPCHRVIGKNGKMTGYGGPSEAGLRFKEQLLALERQSRQSS